MPQFTELLNNLPEDPKDRDQMIREIADELAQHRHAQELAAALQAALLGSREVTTNPISLAVITEQVKSKIAALDIKIDDGQKAGKYNHEMRDEYSLRSTLKALEKALESVVSAVDHRITLPIIGRKNELVLDVNQLDMDALVKAFTRVRRLIDDFEHDLVEIIQKDDHGLMPAVMTFADRYIDIIILKVNTKLIFHIAPNVDKLKERSDKGYTKRARDIIAFLKEELYGISDTDGQGELWVECENCGTHYTATGAYVCPQCNSNQFKLSNKLSGANVNW